MYLQRMINVVNNFKSMMKIGNRKIKTMNQLEVLFKVENNLESIRILKSSETTDKFFTFNDGTNLTPIQSSEMAKKIQTYELKGVYFKPTPEEV